VTARRRLQLHGVEEGVATVETEEGRLFDLPAWMLPAGARAGDRFDAQVEPAGADAVRLRIRRDDEATTRGRAEAAARLGRLTRDDDGGDLDL
jgi:hypothetical protein